MSVTHTKNKRPGEHNLLSQIYTSKYSNIRLMYTLIFIVFSFYLLVNRNSYFLEWAETLSLFLPTAYYFHDCMRLPGGLLTYLGTFLTQFFYFPIIGSILFIAILTGIQQLAIIAFRIPKRYYPLSFIPGLMLLLSITNLGYTWITLKSPGYFFSNAMGCVLFLICFIGYQKIKDYRLRTVMICGTTIIGYPLCGFYALFASLLCLLHELISSAEAKDIKKFIPIVCGIIAAILIPQLYYYYTDNYMLDSDIYTIGLPAFAFNATEFNLWLPFIILFCTFPIYFPLARLKQTGKEQTRFALSSALFIAGICFTLSASYDNENFRASIKMDLAIRHNDWKKVTTIAQNLRGTPTRDIVAKTNLALLKSGYNNKIFGIPEKSPTPTSSRPMVPLMAHMSGQALSYHTGQVNNCYRWCMEGMVEYGMRVFYLEYMVKCSLVNKEFQLAQKYNAMLSKTLFHKAQAKKYQTYIDNPQLVERDKEGIFGGLTDCP